MILKASRDLDVLEDSNYVAIYYSRDDEEADLIQVLSRYAIEDDTSILPSFMHTHILVPSDTCDFPSIVPVVIKRSY